MQVELIDRIKETGDTFSFIFKPDKAISWKAGQFIFYRIPHKNPDKRGIKRHFTIASAPYENNIRLTCKFDFKNGSSFKKDLYGLDEGARVEAFNVGGQFILKDTGKKYVFLAGGIGITPFRAILLDLMHKDLGPVITLLYGNKDNDITFKDTLNQLELDNSWLKVNYVIEPRLIDEGLINSSVKDIYNSIFYVSGPLKMVQIMEKMLVSMNIKKENMVVDYFPGYGES